MITPTIFSVVLGVIMVVDHSAVGPDPEWEATVRCILDRSWRIVDTCPPNAISGLDKETLLQAIAEARAKVGDLEGALRAVEEIDRERQREFVRATCEFMAAAREARCGRPTMARDILRRAIDHCRAVAETRLWDKSRLLALQAGVEMLLGDERSARESAQKVYQAVEKLQSFHRAEAPLEDVARDFVETVWEELGGVPFRIRLTELGVGEQHPVPDELLRRLALERARKGHAEGALDAAERIGDPKVHLRALIGVAEVQADVGDTVSARIALKRAAQTIDAVGGAHARLHLLHRLALAHLRADDREMALTILGGIEPIEGTRWISEPDDLAAFAVALAAVGREEAAERWLKQAQGLAEALTDHSHRQFALLRVAMAYVDIDEFEEASRIAACCDYRNDVMQRIALGRAKTGEMDRAISAVKGITDQGARRNAVRWVAHTLAVTGHLPLALEWSERHDCPLLRAWALLGSAQGILETETSPSRPSSNKVRIPTCPNPDGDP